MLIGADQGACAFLICSGTRRPPFFRYAGDFPAILHPFHEKSPFEYL